MHSPLPVTLSWTAITWSWCYTNYIHNTQSNPTWYCSVLGRPPNGRKQSLLCCRAVAIVNSDRQVILWQIAHLGWLHPLVAAGEKERGWQGLGDRVSLDVMLTWLYNHQQGPPSECNPSCFGLNLERPTLLQSRWANLRAHIGRSHTIQPLVHLPLTASPPPPSPASYHISQTESYSLYLM